MTITLRLYQQHKSFYCCLFPVSRLVFFVAGHIPSSQFIRATDEARFCIFPAWYRVTPCTILPGVRAGVEHGVDSAATTHEFLSYYGSELAPWVS
jgi:hypothetical protein